MRLLNALLLTVMLLAGQAHACAGAWMSAAGSACGDCPSGVLRSVESPTIASGVDCRDCCTFESCDDHGSRRMSASIAGIQFDFAFTQAEIQLPIAPRDPVRSAFLYVVPGYPNPPPGRASCRAPPALWV